MSLCNIQSLELGGYVYVGDTGMEIYPVFLRTETAQRQVTKIIYLKMSVIICSMFAYWIYSLLGFFLKPTVNTLVAGWRVRGYLCPAMKGSRNPERLHDVKLLDWVPEMAASHRVSSASEIISLSHSLISSASAPCIWGFPCAGGSLVDAILVVWINQGKGIGFPWTHCLQEYHLQSWIMNSFKT